MEYQNFPQIVKNSIYKYEKKLREISRNVILGELYDYSQYQTIRICGISRKKEENDGIRYRQMIRQIYAGVCQTGHAFNFCLCGDENGVAIRLMAEPETMTFLKGTIQGIMDGVHSQEEKDPNWMKGFRRIGQLIGAPGSDYDQPIRNIDPVYAIASGMMGTRYAVMFCCHALQKNELDFDREELQKEAAEAASEQQYVIPAGTTDQVSQTLTVSSAEAYLKEVQNLLTTLQDARVWGYWKVSAICMTESIEAMARLGALLQSAYQTGEYQTCPVQFVSATRESIEKDGALFMKLSGCQLARCCAFPEKELPGFFVNEYIHFDQTPRRIKNRNAITMGGVRRSVFSEDETGEYSFEYPDFDRHALIVGMTGSGKTTTVKSLLKTLYLEKGIPFWVVESAKSEYWQMAGLSGFEDLQVFSPGLKDCSFRLNPFECLKGFPLQTHVDSLLSAFKAAFEMYVPMPFLLEQAVYQVYQDFGWDIATGENSLFKNEPEWPSLEDLYWEIPRTVNQSAYDKEIKENVTGALQTRVRSLMVGGKGEMLNIRRSTPLDELLKMPVVMELENLGDDETKAFVMGLAMNSLYEYRRTSLREDEISKPFSHLLIIEEAHRLLKNVEHTQGGNNSQAAAVSFFCNLLSEIRSYGQGIMIADQSPSKLARDTLRNTNLKIVHRLVDAEDRETVGKSMNMTGEQLDALPVLKRGIAAVYAEGDNHPLLVHFPFITSERRVLKCQACSSVRAFTEEAANKNNPEYAACKLCCYYQDGCISPDTEKRARRCAGHMTGLEKNIQETLQAEGFHGETMKWIVENAACAEEDVPYNGDRFVSGEWDKDRRMCTASHILEAANIQLLRQMGLLVQYRKVIAKE